MLSAQKKNLIYIVIIFFSIGTTVHLLTKNSTPKTKVWEAGSQMTARSEEDYLEDEKMTDYAEEKRNENNSQEDSGIKNAETVDFSAKKARDSVRKSNLSHIYSQLLIYHDAHGDTYPVGGERMVKLNDKESAVYKALVPDYVSENLIKDPNDPKSYYGYKSVDGKDFELTALLENTDDKSCIKVNDLCIYKYDSQGEVSGQQRKIVFLEKFVHQLS